MDRDAEMARRIDNLGVDGSDLGGVELTPAEFEQFIAVMERSGVGNDVLEATRNAGFAVPLTRSRETESVFQFCQIPPTQKVLAICREGSLEDMKVFVAVMVRVGDWPKSPN
jgi:hypothetical protein